MSPELLTKAFDRLPDPALIVSLDAGRPIAANAAFIAATALTRREVLQPDGPLTFDDKGWRPLERALRSVTVVKAPRLGLRLGNDRVEMPDVRLERLDVDGRAYVLITSRGAAMTPSTRITPLPEPAQSDESGADEVARLRSIIDTAPQWIVVTDRDGLIEIWNETAQRETGHRRDATLSGRKIWDLLFPDSALRAGFVARMRAIIEHGEAVDSFETNLTKSDKSTSRVEWCSRQLVDERGAPAGMVGVAREIGREVRARRRLRAKLEATSWLLDGAEELLSVREAAGVFPLAARRMRDLCAGQALLFVEEILDEGRRSQLRAVGGHPREIAYASSTCRRDPTTLAGEMAPERLEAAKRGRLVTIPGGLDHLLGELVEPDVARALGSYCGVDEPRCIGAVFEGEVFALVTVVAKDALGGHHASRLEAYAATVGRALAARSSLTELTP